MIAEKSLDVSWNEILKNRRESAADKVTRARG
jgi:hypothetical protein